MSKTKEMNEVVDGYAKRLFGRVRSADNCVCCNSTMVTEADFRDNLSRKEFGISGFCQKCQDVTFGV